MIEGDLQSFAFGLILLHTFHCSSARPFFVYMAQTVAGPKSPFRGLFESPTESDAAPDAADLPREIHNHSLLVQFCCMIFTAAVRGQFLFLRRKPWLVQKAIFVGFSNHPRKAPQLLMPRSDRGRLASIRFWSDFVNQLFSPAHRFALHSS